MLSPNINRTRTLILTSLAQYRASLTKWLIMTLVAACLVFNNMSPIAPIVMANGKERSNNRADKNAELTTTSGSSSGKTGSVTTSDRPGKPDDHNSNGDDVPVRPPRQAKR